MTGVKGAFFAVSALVFASLSACSSDGSATASHETPKSPPTSHQALTLSRTCFASEALLRKGHMSPGHMRARIVALAEQGDLESQNALAALINALRDQSDGSAGASVGALLQLRKRCASSGSSTNQ